MPSPLSISSSNSSSGSRTRVYLSVWLANSKFKYGVILAQKHSNGDGLGHVFNRTSYSQHDVRPVRDAQLAGAMLLCKVECSSEKEDQLRAYLATLYREGKHKDDEQVLFNLAVKVRVCSGCTRYESDEPYNCSTSSRSSTSKQQQP